jgi:hypothetical protein
MRCSQLHARFSVQTLLQPLHLSLMFDFDVESGLLVHCLRVAATTGSGRGGAYSDRFKYVSFLLLQYFYFADDS